MKAIILPAVISFVFSALSFSQDKPVKLVEAGAKLEKLAGGFEFTEGPSSDSNGNVYFTDQPNDRIMMWSDKEGLKTFLQPSGRSNGLAFDKQGNLWACADEKNELWIIKPDKNITVIPSKYNGKQLNGPNDLWIAPDGGVYFTDPFYSRPWWDHSEVPQDCRGVYYLTPDHSKIIRVSGGELVQPNGIVGTPDGKKLFVADIGGNKTWSYSILSDGTLTDKTLFCNLGSDGMTIDSRGNVYLTGKGVTIFDKKGNTIGNIEVPEPWTANVCFGGAGLNNLFITASKGLYRIKLRVRGTKG